MSSLGPALLCATGGALVVSAGLDTLEALRAGRGSRAGSSNPAGRRGPAGGTALLGRCVAAIRRAGRRYEASAAGHRLAGRLDAASVRGGAALWRARQAAATLALALLVYAAAGSALWSASIAMSCTRLGGRLLLRSRRRRRDEELCLLTATLARHLATELASGAAPGEACRSLGDTEDARASPRLTALLAAVELRTSVGESPTIAVHRAVEELAPGPGRDLLGVLATDLELVVERGCGTAVLTRLARGIDERRQTIAEVRAATAEIRMAAIAIPALALLLAAALVMTDPEIAAAALSPIGMVTFAFLGSLATAGTVAVRRLTCPPELV
ncbi:MAG TPA: hypothetical protein VFO60_04020 [Candidatus Dormibacteraeota bacterium]|nr:hypothetical protein [Candidatus Dormibacteraeota bacterium]